MRRRDRRRTRAGEGFTAPARVDPDYVVGVAVEAKLFGRLRLLTLDAAVGVRRTGVQTALDLPSASASNADGWRRSEVEAVLQEARSVLERGGDDGHGPVPRNGTKPE